MTSKKTADSDLWYHQFQHRFHPMDQAGRIILPARSLPPAESLWFSATLGTCDVEFETKLSNAGFTPLPFGAGSWTQDALYEQRNLVSYAVDRDSLDRPAP